MSIVLLYSAALFALSAVLLFKDRLQALWVSQLIIGIGYLAWGFAQTSGVADEHVTDRQMSWIYSGLTLISVGLALFWVWFFLDLRRRMPA